MNALDRFFRFVGKNVLQYGIIAFAIELSFCSNIDPEKIKPHVPERFTSYITTPHVVSILSTLIYMIFLFILVGVYKRLDKQYVCRGRYLSLPHDHPEQFNIFDITAGLFRTGYSLDGERYSLSNATPRQTGNWFSETLDIKLIGTSAVIAYLYFGNKTDSETDPKDKTGTDPKTAKSFEGHGYAKIFLRGEKLDEGHGYWIDDETSPTPRHQSDYFKLTRDDLRWLLVKDEPMYSLWRSRFPGRKRDIAKAYAKLPPNHPLRQRPAQPP